MTSTSPRRSSITRSATSRWSASPRLRCTGARNRSSEAGPVSLEEIGDHAVDFWLSTEDLPKPDNRVTLRDDGAIRLSYSYSNEKPKKELYDKLKSILGHIGMHEGHLLPHHAYLKNEIPVAGVAHQTGTCRFGADPADSVLDTNCKAHELDNLYVVDTSFFPSIGAVNPALTAMANALRVGDHLLERLGADPTAELGSDGFARVSTAASRPDPRRRVRRDRRRAQAEEGGRRRRARRRPRLPHVPAAALPGRDGPARQSAVGIRFATCSTISRTRRPPATRRRSTSESARSQFAEMAPLTYDYLVLALGAGVNFFGVEGAAEHAFPLYTLADAVRLKEHVLERWEAADRDPSLVEDGALNVVIVGGGPTGVESAAPSPSSTAATSPRTTRACRRSRRSLSWSRPVRRCSRCSIRSSRTTPPSGSRAGRRGAARRGRLVGHPDQGDAEVGTRAQGPHPRLGRGARGASARPDARRRARARQPDPGRARAQPGDHPEVFAVGDIAWITDAKTGDELPQLGSVALQAGERAGENIAGASRASRGAVRLPRQGHDGDDRPRARR